MSMRMLPRWSLLSLVLGMIIFGCSKKNKDLHQASMKINAKDVSGHIAVLASDDFEGRAPSSRGEELTVNYLKDEFSKLGLLPGNGSSYFQEVPLVAITADPGTKLTVANSTGSESLQYSTDFMAWTKRVVGRAAVHQSEMVFVGYGIVAPEYHWNDYKDVDVEGKTVVILVNDPGYASKKETLFHGGTMTYYGRWTYKFEEAARQGATAAFIVHETKPAGYPWEVVVNSWSGKQFDLASDNNNMDRCVIEGWLQEQTAIALFKLANVDFQVLKKSAQSENFQAVSLGLKATLALQNNIEHSISHNVIAVVPGSTRADETILYSAHWDHFGLDPALEGDKIYNGALDNASGTAGLLELAKAFKALQKPPLRSIAFLAVTAEEQGLLGSQYYASNPIFPRQKTVAAINMDGLNIFGKMMDITVIGLGMSDLDDYVIRAAKEQGRSVRSDPEPGKGYYYRSDHFSFAKQGIPALYTDMGINSEKHGEQWTLQQLAKYTAEKYHKPSDEYEPDWDLSGAVDDLRILFDVGYHLSMESTFPNWKAGTEFKAIRDKEMRKAFSQSK